MDNKSQTRISFIEQYASSAAEAVGSVSSHADTVSGLVASLVEIVQAGGRIYSCGNGGSACDSMHLTEELVARYLRERPGIAAHHLQDASTITCWSNDYDFDSVFERQVETLMTSNDILFGFSTSGNSANISRALAAAKKKGAQTVLFSGKTGGACLEHADHSFVISSEVTSHIQEAHITLVHIICDLLEQELFF